MLRFELAFAVPVEPMVAVRALKMLDDSEVVFELDSDCAAVDRLASSDCNCW